MKKLVIIVCPIIDDFAEYFRGYCMSELTEKKAEKCEQRYFVVKNHEEQYSIWPTYKSIPKGWVAEGYSNSKEKCLSYIDKVWVDMRPLSLRKKMGQMDTKEG